MERQHLHYYNRELKYFREMSGEFAREFPKIAGRLALDAFDCADPYIERLIESFAFLTSRIQIKLDAEFPRFTQSLLETVFPHYLAPLPSMAVVQFQPDLRQDALSKGYSIPRGTIMRSLLGKNERTPCKYVTAHDLTLAPVEITEAQYHTRDLAAQNIPRHLNARAAVRIRLQAPPGKKLSAKALDSIPIYLKGVGETSMRLYEQIFAHTEAILVRPGEGPNEEYEVLPPEQLNRVGFDQEQAMLPGGSRSYSGYRLLEEYFAFPERFMFAEVSGLAAPVERWGGNTLEILIILDTVDLSLEDSVTVRDFELNCTPAVNLFPHRADRIHVNDSRAEFHVIPDRTRPMDFEVYRVLNVTGYGKNLAETRSFRPFYAVKDMDMAEESRAYFMPNRRPRVVSEHQLRRGSRLNYTGSEVFISLVDGKASPYSTDLSQLGVEVLCTNRDLPLRMPLGRGKTDFVLESAAPVQAIRCLDGPTPPKPSEVHGEYAWRLISHLSLNYLSLMETAGTRSASALQDILSLYIDQGNPGQKKQVEGVVGLSARPVTRRVVTEGAIAFARGNEITLKLEESGFEGTGVFLMGAVLERFFSQYASLNSFTETVVETLDRGMIMRWKPRIGQRDIV